MGKQLPDGYSYGLFFNLTSGKKIDEVWGAKAGIPRKRWWFFKESDASYKYRLAIADYEKSVIQATPR